MNYQPKYDYIPPADRHSLTPFYDPFCRLIGLGSKFKEKILNFARLQGRETIADVGCGTGIFLEVAAQKYPQARWFGLDPDEAALKIAAHRLQKFSNITLEKGFAEALPWPDQTVDVCFSTLAIHHMPNDIKRRAISEMYRVLKPDGQIIITDFGPSKSWWLRKLLFFENIEYLKGNLDGLVLQYLKQAGFKNQQIIGQKFPNVISVIGSK